VAAGTQILITRTHNNTLLLETFTNFSDFELLDTATGIVLERWGEIVLAGVRIRKLSGRVRLPTVNGQSLGHI